jgi:hypothetical protein
LFLWWWTISVAVITLTNFVYHLFFLLPHVRALNVHRHLRRSIKYSPIVNELDAGSEWEDNVDGSKLMRRRGQRPQRLTLTRREVTDFTYRCLRADGVLIMRFISNHSGDLLAARILAEMYQRFCRREFRPRNFNVGYGKGMSHRPLKDKDALYPPHSSSTSTTTEHEQAAQGYQEQLATYTDAGTLPKKTDPTAPMLTTEEIQPAIPASPSTRMIARQPGTHYPGPPPPQMQHHID